MFDAAFSESLEDLFETAPCGYLSASPDGRILVVNSTLADWLGRSPEDLIGKPLHDIFAFGARIAFETHLAPLLRMQGYVHEIALDLLHAGGEKIPMIGNAAEKRGGASEHLATRFTLLKAVDRRTYERTLLERRIAAEEETAAVREGLLLRDQFIAVLGHDLRNPLGAVSAGLRMLTRRQQLSPSGTAITGEMAKSVARATKLIDDLLDLARGSLGGGFIVERNSDEPLAQVLEHVVAEVRAISPDHAIETQVAIEEPVFCDRGRLGQMASNLLANAVTHGAPGQPIRFEARTASDELVISVANAGDPIPPEARERLFHPFFRGEARLSRQGLGLGLYIASEIAKAHLGAIDVHSDEQETRFTFRMPRFGHGHEAPDCAART